jgi:hypothetical protein
MIIAKGSSWDGYSDGTSNVNFGTFVNAAVGSGNVISSSNTTIHDVLSDDGGVALSGDTRSVRARVLLTVAQSGGNVYVTGLLGHTKLCAVADTCTASFRSGLRGYFESISGSTVGDMSTGVVGLVDAPAGATIGSGYVSSFLACSSSLAGTHTGKAVAMDVRQPQTAGTFDALLHVVSGSGATGTTYGSIDANKCLLVYYNDTLMKIPLYAA